MPRMVRCGLIRLKCEWSPGKIFTLPLSRRKMIAKHETLDCRLRPSKKYRSSASRNFSTAPTSFCAEQQTRWYELDARRSPTVPQSPQC